MLDISFFLHLIKSNCTLSTNDAPNHHIPLELTDEEIQALRYTAGYIPRSLKKKILKSSCDHKQKQDLVLCLEDLLADETEEPSESAEWLTALNRGGLLCVNNMTFEFFYAMELEFRKHVGGEGIIFNAAEMMERNEDVLLCWNIISASWDEECSSSLLQMIIKLWITIRDIHYQAHGSRSTRQLTKRRCKNQRALERNLLKNEIASTHSTSVKNCICISLCFGYLLLQIYLSLHVLYTGINRILKSYWEHCPR